MTSAATTVAEYLAQLPEDRLEAIESVREVILKHLPTGYEEGMQYGMIGYYVPHSIYPGGYHCDPKQPLPFAALASQKNYMSIYLNLYTDGDDLTWFQEEWAKTGKKLDMGKCCVRFKKLESLSLDLVGAAIARWPVERTVQVYASVDPRNKKK